MKILKGIFTYIVMTIFAIIITILLVLNLLETTIFNKKYVLAKLDETDYYNKIYYYVESNFEKYIYQSGLDEDVMKNIVTVDKVKEDTHSVIDNIYDNSGKEIETDELVNNLVSNIENSLNENQTIKKDAIETFTKTISNEYTKSISHYKYEKNINNGYTIGLKYIFKVKNICFVAIVICIAFLFIINIKAIYKFIANIGISLLASGILFIVGKIYITSKIKISNINVLNSAVSDTLKNIGFELISIITRYCFILVIIGILLIIIPTYLYNLKNKNIDQKN